MMKAALVVAVALAAAGCGGGESIDPELTVRRIVEGELTRQGVAASALTEVSCVGETSQRFECILVLEEGGVEERVVGTLTCDEPGQGARCLWRGELHGG